MSIETKRHIELGVDGVTQLFQAPDEYIDGSLWVFDLTSGGATSLVEPIDVGGGFYQITPAPAVGSKLYITYDIEIESVADNDGLLPWEHNNINTLLDVAKAQSLAIKTMEEALLSRMTKDDFNAWAAVMEQAMKDLEARS